MKILKSRNIIIGIVLLVLSLLSVFVLAKVTSDPMIHEKTISALDEKKGTVLALTAASAGVATALAAVPGDATTPVANKLVDLTSYFLIILVAIFLEKYLITLTGYVAFRFLIPGACILYMMGLCFKKHGLKVLAGKVAAFGIIIFLLIPLSMRVSGMIEKTYDFSVENVMQEAERTTKEINENADEDGNILTKALSKIKGGVSGIVNKGEALLNSFIEAIAVMIVTSCVIPIVVFLFAVWLAKIIFEIPTSIPTSLPGRRKHITTEE